MRLIDRVMSGIRGGSRRQKPGDAAYLAIVARARRPHWYVDGGVADNVDGRFDMIAAILCMVLLRLEAGEESAQLSVAITERFVDDMDGQLREIGIGDIVVGKHVGKMMGMLGGRLGAYREGLAQRDLSRALVRNLYRDVTPTDDALAHVNAALLRLSDHLAELDLDAIEAGELPE